MKDFLIKATRIVLFVFVAVWVMIMLLAILIGPSIDVSAADDRIYRLEVLWIFSVPALATIYKLNPKGVFNKVGVSFLKGIKRTLIYIVCVSILTISVFLVIDSKHSDSYLTQLKANNQTNYEIIPTISSTDDVITLPEDTTPIAESTTPTETTIPATDAADVPSTSPETNKPTTNTEPTQTEPPVESRFVGKEGCTFNVSGAFDCDGVIYEIHSVKILSDRDSESPDYNYYKIFFDFTIKNERKSSISWNLAYNGNFYGLLCHRGAERDLGGNSNIKDDDYSDKKQMSSGTLAPGQSSEGYRSLVCMPDSVDNPKDTWPLYSDEPFELELHLVVDNTDYELTIHFNQ